MQRVSLFSIIMLFLVAVGCGPTYVESIVTNQGAVIDLNGVQLEVPANSVTDSVTIRLQKFSAVKHRYDQGYRSLGLSFAVLPETLVFDEPAVLSYATTGENTGIGVKTGKGFIPLPDAEVRGETLYAPIWHGGEYCLIEKAQSYGIVEHSDKEEGLLIVSDIYVGSYISSFKQTLRRNEYDLPIWLYVYQPEKSIEENAQLLHNELKNLHGEYGKFRLDVVSFGIGGLVTHRYLTDSAYYAKDISSAVIAVGTPFFGSNFAIFDNAKHGSSPLRFTLIDGMAEHVSDLEAGSSLLTLVREKKHLPGFHYFDDPTENKNFVSLHGQKRMDGSFPEEIAGDGLVPFKSAMLTAIEPAAFNLSHFDLFESEDVQNVAVEFVRLYRGFNWPLLFSRVWNGAENVSRINETWERETRLHMRDDADFDALLEFNNNMLNSAPVNAVLVTNGDYDTYPAWLLQEKGVRSDVLIVNRSLINIKDYARFLKRNGLPLEISEQELERLEHKKTDKKFLSISDQLIKLLLKQTIRPVVLSTTVYDPAQYGYPLKLSGLVYELRESDIDVVRTKQLLYEVFKFDKLFSQPLDSFNVNIQNIAKNYAAIAFSLSSALAEPHEYEEAIKALEFAKRFADEPMFYYNEAQIYFKMGKEKEADQMLERLLKMEAGDMRLRKEVARIYYENGMSEKAVSILAGILEEQPAEKEILDLIRKYQGE
jgi:tetratricopeptide (TPR) repeat protein